MFWKPPVGRWGSFVPPARAVLPSLLPVPACPRGVTCWGGGEGEVPQWAGDSLPLLWDCWGSSTGATPCRVRGAQGASRRQEEAQAASPLNRAPCSPRAQLGDCSIILSGIFLHIFPPLSSENHPDFLWQTVDPFSALCLHRRVRCRRAVLGVSWVLGRGEKRA